jgi:hypothetical protein
MIRAAVELAVQDFDRVVFGISMLHKGEEMKYAVKFLPELVTAKNLDLPKRWTYYDQFNIDAFFEFCKKNPIDGTN